MSKPTIDELEILTPDQLMKLLLDELRGGYQNIGYINDLIVAGCPIDSRVFKDWIPLHVAAFGGQREVVKLLVSNGAQVDVRDSWSQTAWDYAKDVVKTACPELEPK